MFVFAGFAAVKSTDLHINLIQSNSLLLQLHAHCGSASATGAAEPNKLQQRECVLPKEYVSMIDAAVMMPGSCAKQQLPATEQRCFLPSLIHP